MAWRSHGDSNEQMVNNLQANNVYRSERVKKAMLAVDRGHFTPNNPYMDAPQGIGKGATISAPHMHAAALELLKDHLVDGNRVLDVGSGSGYLTACMACMLGPTGLAVGIDHIEELVNTSVQNVKKGNSDLISSGRLKLVTGDGRAGFPSEAPYNVIHVGAAAPSIPQPLLDQLAAGGRMVLPVGEPNGDQKYVQVDKDSQGKITQRNLMGVIYVPLTDKKSQIARSRDL